MRENRSRRAESSGRREGRERRRTRRKMGEERGGEWEGGRRRGRGGVRGEDISRRKDVGRVRELEERFCLVMR